MMIALMQSAGAAEGVERQDLHVTTEDGLRLFVRELRPPSPDAGAAPVILVHGARVPGLASFDLPVPGGSFASDLALHANRIVYVMDARGYGGSERPAALAETANANPPQARAYQVVRDIAAVVSLAKARTGSPTVSLLGWATGGMWVAYYTSLHPEAVGHLITLNALYGGSARHSQFGPGSPVSDPAHPDRLGPSIGAYARYDAASLLPGWDKSIPVADKSAWRDPAVAAAYQRAALASDTESGKSDPPAFRAPLGAIEDSFYQASGRRLFDASSITARTLVVRSDLDFWSRPEDVQAFAHDAAHAASLEILTLPEATHFVHLDRPDHGRDRLLHEVRAFLADR
ncbi:MAG: alpha/beta hydrolase [Proteobacteria bacterium]|nr:alpha/beta hydrolase [Pseudomonadota bacterium]